MAVLTKPSDAKLMNPVQKLVFQIKLLMWKRYCEQTKSKFDLMKVILPPILFFVLLILMYEVFTFFYPGGLEPLIVPFGFWIFVQRIVVQIMYEKSSRLQESMRMMGLSDVAYWASYFISDGVILGFCLSFICTIFTTGGLFNDGNFGAILGLLFCFCLSVVPFAFFLCSFFDTPQTSGQATLGVLFGFYVLYVVIFTVDTVTISYKSAQIICCLFPPIALQIGAESFLSSYDDYGGLPLSSICGIMIADIFIYSLLAWYFSQVWFSKVGVPKPFYFPLMPSYWFPKSDVVGAGSGGAASGNKSGLNEAIMPSHAVEAQSGAYPIEAVNEGLLGAPTVVIKNLRKAFNGQLAVNDLSFNMYENQIFALLGHNGAGKTTTISMLTGLIGVDYATAETGAFIYGHSVQSEMDRIRYSMGVCPQHDVLFENLSVKEHILFFAQLKGASYGEALAETTTLANLFHLDERYDHLGSELSGGQKRKLSVAIAVCGGSKFVVLDEPTAGMDPLARRELWDLLASLRKGRTMLLTTHYMDEADILGDRVGIMSLGQMQCVGSTQFLKSTYGAGYKLIFDRAESMDNDRLAALTAFVKKYIPEAKYTEEDGSENQVLYTLPFNTVKAFGPFFTALDSTLEKLHVSNYGVTITSLEDVFLKVGEDHSVTPTNTGLVGIGSDRQYTANFTSQVIGIAKRKLTYAINDFITIPLLLLPIAAAIAAAVLYNKEIISHSAFVNDLVISGMYVGAFLGAPGLIAEFIVRERNDKLRNVLTVMGCDFRAYWLGTFIADYIIMAVPMVIIWITWGAADMPDFFKRHSGLNFFILMLFNFQMIAFSYFFSFIFNSPKSCISLMPIVIIVLILLPNIIILICIELATACGTSISQDVQGGALLWGTMILSPHGALFSSLLNTTQDFSKFISTYPPISACIVFMIVESALYLYYAFYTDASSVSSFPAVEDPNFDPAVLANLDEDVQAERDKTLNGPGDEPLRIERLRKVFPPKVVGKKAVTATEDVAFTVESGEIFGLLGANGAGKTTTLSMLTRHLIPTSGNAFVNKFSILSDFSKAATHLGVVTQNNSLWDRLSVEAHLKLFARLRGVPEDLVYKVVDGTIDQLELTPHRKKLSMRLSGGMKRKLCVAIALIGDPEVVLLDEPSAGLDPVSRRNLWSVILRTMSHRAVILTTHSMDEAEALCKRIGIMVYGQLRALGTKQHLKNKFGSGFELVVKLNIVDFAKQLDQLTSFVNSMFPSAVILSENGGLITYQIPREEMKMGVAFSNIENEKERLGIEDYSIAQPTLEQVFIRTVNKYETKKKSNENAGNPLFVGGSVRMSIEGTDLLEGQIAEPVEGVGAEAAADEVVYERNKLGCTNYFVKIMSLVTGILTVILMVGGIAAHKDEQASSALIFFAFVFLITSVVGCNILCCACCQNPKGADE